MWQIVTSDTLICVLCHNLNKTKRKHLRGRRQAGRELGLRLKSQPVQAEALWPTDRRRPLVIRSPTTTPAAWRNWGRSALTSAAGQANAESGNRTHRHRTRHPTRCSQNGHRIMPPRPGPAEQAAGRGLCHQGSGSWTRTRDLRSPPPGGLRPRRPRCPSPALGSELATQTVNTDLPNE